MIKQLIQLISFLSLFLHFSSTFSNLVAIRVHLEPRIPLGIINIKRKYQCDKTRYVQKQYESLFRSIVGRGIESTESQPKKERGIHLQSQFGDRHWRQSVLFLNARVISGFWGFSGAYNYSFSGQFWIISGRLFVFRVFWDRKENDNNNNMT